MEIIINIIKTERGYNYRNAESGKLVATVNEGRNKPGVYYWELPCEHGWGNEAQAHYQLQEVLRQRADNLGIGINFNNYNF